MQYLSFLFKVSFGKDLISLFFGLAEDDSTSMTTTVEVDDVSDDGVAMVIGTVECEVFYSFGCSDFGVLDEVYDFAIGGEVLAREVDDPGGDSCRKEQILCFSGAVLANVFENLFDVFLKALFQHFICLIEASYLQVGKLYASPFEQVNQSARGRNHYIASIADLAYLLVYVTASIHCYHFEVSSHS